jgi:hypothetical protein
VTSTVLSVLAVLGTAFGIVWTVRAQRRLVAASALAQEAGAGKAEQEAAGLQEQRISQLHKDLADEQRLRLALERQLAGVERSREQEREEWERQLTSLRSRLQRVEEQVRRLGHVPVNGEATA